MLAAVGADQCAVRGASGPPEAVVAHNTPATYWNPNTRILFRLRHAPPIREVLRDYTTAADSPKGQVLVSSSDGAAPTSPIAGASSAVIFPGIEIFSTSSLVFPFLHR